MTLARYFHDLNVEVIGVTVAAVAKAASVGVAVGAAFLTEILLMTGLSLWQRLPMGPLLVPLVMREMPEPLLLK